MARYKQIDLSPRFLPVVLEAQLIPGSFAHAVHHLVDHLDLSAFDAHFRNDVNGASAYAPSILLKAVLLAYSQGIISSRGIEYTCRHNVVFIALTGDAKPHFTTFADFISRSRDAIASVFAQVLSVLGQEGLIGREMFAIDGVKLPSNASKYRAGTRDEFLAQADKLEGLARKMLDAHGSSDAAGEQTIPDARVVARITRMSGEAQKIRTWLTQHPEDRRGPSGKVRKSHLIDNESAKMATDKGVVQGYCGAAVVDAAHQVIVEASAFGTGSEQEILMPVLEACADQRTPTTLITADTGYYSEANLAFLAASGIEALIPDNRARGRDERQAGREKHTTKKRAMHLQTRGKKAKPKLFAPEDFIIAPDQSYAICPAGKRLYRTGGHCSIGGYTAVKFRGPKSACVGCPLRAQCLQKPDVTQTRQVAVLTRYKHMEHSQRMRERIDSEEGRRQYAQRLGTVEPVFGNIRHNKRMNRFTLRGQFKVDGQWKLYAIVHNIEKWAHRHELRDK